MKKSIYVLAVIALTFTACKNEKKTEDHHEGEKTEMHDNSDGHHDEEKAESHDNSDGHHDNDKSDHNEERNIEASVDKNAATSAMIDGYLEIKNGLVSDDKAAAAKGGETLLKAFSNFDMSTLSGDQHKEYMEIVENATEQAEHIVKSPIDHQREHFESLSEDMIDIVALLGTEKTLYEDYCPMKKTSWLSESKDIKNPFYGSKMLSCGKVQKQIN
ncbi:MAG: heavy metal transporter [Flavobacterium sp.]|nr:MAG: heavy metal transporter [Flavobacterium sp.]